jgi:hypothetical protein
VASEESGPNLFEEWEKSVASWWTTVLDDPAFVRGMGDALAGRGQAVAAMQENVDKAMEAWHLPSKRDLLRLSRVASLLEDRLVALEDQVGELGARLDRIEKDALKARIESAETRVMLEEKLGVIAAKLDRLLGEE